jgi:hypothetical protein
MGAVKMARMNYSYNAEITWSRLRRSGLLTGYFLFNQSERYYMKNEIYEAMENLFSVLKKHAPYEAVSCEIFINHEGFEYTMKHRSAIGDKNNSMKNIAGDWIIK